MINKDNVSSPLRATNHPCFNFEAKYKHGRVHLPVAAGCNIQCNYCNRKYDCVNESRPGVSSQLLTPYQASEYVKKIKQVDGGRISVIGIAGPGDPFATPENTLETIRLVRNEFPEMLFCLSSNGLNILPYIEELKELGVTHVTITINGVVPAVLGEIYSWVRFQKKVYRGVHAGAVLLEQQLLSIEKLKAMDFVVKVNSVVLPGINDWHIIDIARKMAEMKVDIINCIPVYPNDNPFFDEVRPPDKALMSKIKTEVSAVIPQMMHCTRCRADAAGILGKDMKEKDALLSECASLPPVAEWESKPYVAVATHEGILVNRHLGEADFLNIYKCTDTGYELFEKRITPAEGLADQRWELLAESLSDCRALLVSGVGNKPMKILGKNRIKVVEMDGLIEEGLEYIFKNKRLISKKLRNQFKCGTSCSGNAMGCC